MRGINTTFIIAEGFIDPQEIKDLSVRVFVSHSHVDHWDERILEWKNTIPDLKYFFGWQAFDDPVYNCLPYPRTSYKDDDIEIFTVNSHHSGVPEAAFLVKVDGLVLFYGGDYQGKMTRRAVSNAADDMRYLREQGNLGDSGIDLMFMGAWFGGSNVTVIKRLDPEVIFPMHGCGGGVLSGVSGRFSCLCGWS